MNASRPHICLTVADDQRATALGVAGIEAVRTPHLDALSTGGVRFSHAFHLGSCHGAICAPSRAMLHTGQPYFHLDPQLLGPTYAAPETTVKVPPTLGQKLRARGYDTFATGKWHNGVASFHASFSSGAQIFFGGMCDHWHVPAFDFDPSGKYPPPNRSFAKGMSTELFAQAAIDFIRSRKDNPEPFFCYCAFTAPHDPRTPPDHWRQAYRPAEMPLLPNMRSSPTADPGTLDLRDERLLGIPREVDELQRSLAEYYGMVSHLDEWIGKIHDAIREIGVWDQTIVAHTADHGLAVGQHGLLGKQNLYDHSVRVPLIISGPGWPRGQVRDSLCYQHDLHPTLLAAAGIPIDGGFQNLLPTSTAPAAPDREFVGCAYADLMRMVRSRRHKLIEYTLPENSRRELFDLDADPWELNNLADTPEGQAPLRSLATALRSWQQSVGDSHPIPDLAG